MAVYFQPQYKPWWADLANTALKEGLSGLMKGMFERDQYARTKNRYNKEWGQMFPEQAQAAQEQPAVMSVQSAPEVAAQQPGQMSTIAREGLMKDSLGVAPQAPKINVPKEYLPASGDGLVALAGKANVANAIAQSQIPTRADFLRRLGTTMSPQNMELALKHAEQMYGPQWKVADQIYKGQQLENVLGAAPEINDKEGNHQYINRQYMYGLDNAANGGINFLNPEYQRQFNAAEAQKARDFTAEQNAIARAFQAREAARSRADAWARAKYGYDQRMKLAQMGGASNGRSGAGNGTAGLSWSDIEKLNKIAQDAMPRIAGKTQDEARRILTENYDKRFLPALEDRFREGSREWTYAGKDAAGVDSMLTGANPFFTESVTPAGPVVSIGKEGLLDRAGRTARNMWGDLTSNYARNYKPTPARPAIPVSQINTVEGQLNPDTVVGPAAATTAAAMRAPKQEGVMADIPESDVYDYMALHPETPYTYDQARAALYWASQPTMEDYLRQWLKGRGRTTYQYNKDNDE